MVTAGLLEPMPAVTGGETGYTLHRLPVYHWAYLYLHQFTQVCVILPPLVTSSHKDLLQGNSTRCHYTHENHFQGHLSHFISVSVSPTLIPSLHL